MKHKYVKPICVRVDKKIQKMLLLQKENLIFQTSSNIQFK